VLKVVPMNDKGELLYEEFLKLLTPKTKLVACTHISNALGTINPVEQIIKDAHQVGAKVLIDACQSVPHMKVDVQKLDCDFLVFSGHKLYGPTGIGILYGKIDLLNELPPYQGGGDMIETVQFDKITYNTPPLRFEAGTPLIAEVHGLGAAIDYVNAVGLDNIHAHETALRNRLVIALEENKRIRLIGTAKEKGAIVSFVVDKIHPLDIGTMLDLKGIAIRTGHHCAQPTMRHFNVSATDRVSFGLYNTEEEVDHFVKALHEVISLF
ncbi:MAG: cysteine desulfurase, partial [Parachlamydiaceae bacterium]